LKTPPKTSGSRVGAAALPDIKETVALMTLLGDGNIHCTLVGQRKSPWAFVMAGKLVIRQSREHNGSPIHCAANNRNAITAETGRGASSSS
jgi:hypothetical protein